MEDADGGLQALVAQVGIEPRQVHRHHQALVGDHRGREAADIEILVPGHSQLDLAPGDVQAVVEGLLAVGVTGDEQLLDAGQTVQGDIPQAVAVGGHRAPADKGQPLLLENLLHRLPAGLGDGFVLTEENLGHTEMFTQLGAEALPGQQAQESVRLFQQQAAAITGFAIRGNAAAVGHAGQGFDCRAQKFVAGLAVHVGDQAKTAVVTDVPRTVQACTHTNASR